VTKEIVVSEVQSGGKDSSESVENITREAMQHICGGGVALSVGAAGLAVNLLSTPVPSPGPDIFAPGSAVAVLSAEPVGSPLKILSMSIQPPAPDAFAGGTPTGGIETGGFNPAMFGD
jgi:hypothetical protein